MIEIAGGIIMAVVAIIVFINVAAIARCFVFTTWLLAIGIHCGVDWLFGNPIATVITAIVVYSWAGFNAEEIKEDNRSYDRLKAMYNKGGTLKAK